jgi:hypothetical protein
MERVLLLDQCTYCNVKIVPVVAWQMYGTGKSYLVPASWTNPRIRFFTKIFLIRILIRYEVRYCIGTVTVPVLIDDRYRYSVVSSVDLLAEPVFVNHVLGPVPAYRYELYFDIVLEQYEPVCRPVFCCSSQSQACRWRVGYGRYRPTVSPALYLMHLRQQCRPAADRWAHIHAAWWSRVQLPIPVPVTNLPRAVNLDLGSRVSVPQQDLRINLCFKMHCC